MEICETECCGCSGCAMICPSGAIRMEENKKGFLVPVVDDRKCVHCKQCIVVCGKSVPYYKTRQAYIAKMKEKSSLCQSQSGGAFTAISDIVLKNGGVVYGAAFNDVFEVVHIRTVTKCGRDTMRGSKYMQSNMKATYRQVEKDLEYRMVLFVGTPCQVAGLKKYLIAKQKNMDNLFTVDLICHGVPTIKIWRDLIAYYEKKENGKVERVIFNENQDGRASFFLCINDKKISDRYHRKLFYTNLSLRKSCYRCEYARIERVGDFTIGDAWGVKEHHPDFWDSSGVSLVLLHTEKAIRLFAEVGKKMHLKQVSLEDYVQPNMRQPSMPHRSVEEFWRDYERKSFTYILHKYARNNVFLNYKYIYRKVVALFVPKCDK